MARDYSVKYLVTMGEAGERINRKGLVSGHSSEAEAISAAKELAFGEMESPRPLSAPLVGWVGEGDNVVQVICLDEPIEDAESIRAGDRVFLQRGDDGVWR